jgi:NADH-quinone oxidoreductase subunit G
VNTEGRVQLASRVIFPPGEAREDWAILRALSAVVGQALPFDSLAELRKKLIATYPHFARIDQIEAGQAGDVAKLASHPAVAMKDGFVSPVHDFYLTNPIARASAVMAECSALAQGRLTQAAE